MEFLIYSVFTQYECFSLIWITVVNTKVAVRRRGYVTLWKDEYVTSVQKNLGSI